MRMYKMTILILLIPSLLFASELNRTQFARDSDTKSIITVASPHHEIHEGDAYVISGIVDLAINNVFDIQITTPNTAKWAHMTIQIDTENETNVYLYENVTISTPGTAAAAINRDRNSSETSGLTIKTISNADTTDANADTAVAGATTLMQAYIGSGRNPGSAATRDELLLKQNEDYSIRFIATAAGYINYRLSWYEHTNL